MTEEANAPSVDSNWACSNGRSQKDECSSSTRAGTGDGGFQKKPLCERGGQEEELLCITNKILTGYDTGTE